MTLSYSVSAAQKLKEALDGEMFSYTWLEHLPWPDLTLQFSGVFML